MLPCAGLPNATGVTPLVAANSWPGEIVRTFPGLVLSFPSTGCAGSVLDASSDEHAAAANNTVPIATAQQLFAMRMAYQANSPRG
jgi:hypothetical protein